MSVNHALPLPQSLPSFAQAFSSSSLSEIPPSNNALPPIHSHSYERTRQTISPPIDQLATSRKRSREEPQPPTPAESPSNSVPQSPSVVRIKEEEDRDMSLVSSTSSPLPSPTANTNPPSPKKRRVTVSGIHLSHQLNPSTSSDNPPSTPVVIAIPSSEDASMRSIQPLKQQQKQCRGGVANIAQSAAPSAMLSPPINGTASCSVTYSPPESALPVSKGLQRLGRRSPNTISGSNRGGNTVASGSRVTLASSTSQPLTPPPMIVPSQQPVTLTTNQPSADAPPNSQQTLPPHSLPPPPISFARRRAAQSGRKKKPADIVISPRGTSSSDSLAPVIQSAPPVPEFGRFPMALPRLPTALSGSQTARRVATNVPPTPTRFSLQHTIVPSVSGAPRSGPPTRSPPAIPIASSLVPPTPSSLQHPGYTGDKPAFLAPFEMFYDALNDSKQMKNWLSEQLQKSNTLLQSLQRVDQVVEDLVDRRTRSMQEEMQSMRQRMDSLEEALRVVRADSARNQSISSVGYPQGSKFSQNGMPSSSEPSSSYRFPATEQRRRVSPPSWGADKDRGASPSPDSDRRMSVSITRVEAPRLLSSDTQSGSYSSFAPGSSHTRGGPVSASASNPKGTPPSRSQAVPERTSAHRQADTRQTNRMFYPGSYNGGSGDGGPTSRGNDSHKNPGAMEER
ncbi:hypothetical protein AZE42_01283 [Rhizopogon vesiculosus]|uniref:Uncharacterized protein n=1 Tax=Rhizopogon vesiculosus TaxID=180088 RepID=A0A1J8PLU9_9AGAM|nr:hypothetical protein AZE42_01283 [Rhizopogon vesiculosus]